MSDPDSSAPDATTPSRRPLLERGRRTLARGLTPCLPQGQERIGMALFFPALAGVYLIAFLSWWVQFPGLVGEKGLIPASEFLATAGESLDRAGLSRSFALPTLFWIASGDGAMHAALAVGILAAVAAAFGYLRGPSLLICWVIYVSLVHTGGPFMRYQWDSLLAETGFLAMLATRWRWRSGWRPAPEAESRIGVFLLWLLIARLMFFSGWVKLAWGDPSWWEQGDAMAFHYETQPLPNPLAWYAHQLPEGMQRLSLMPVYFIEMVLPFAVFAGARARLVAALGFAGLMGLIALTGNYTFFNLLTAVLCLPLVADRFWPKRVRRAFGLAGGEVEDREAKVEAMEEEAGLGGEDNEPGRGAGVWFWFERIGRGVRAGCFGLLGVVTVAAIDGQLQSKGAVRLKAPFSVVPQPLHTLHQSLGAFMLVNQYGLFRVMTRERPEIILEGSEDGEAWRPYALRWKPGALGARPRQVAPHQPRLAWQFWFLALERRYRPGSWNSGWFSAVIEGLMRGDERVIGLFEGNPFPDGPPRYLRARLYEYRFTSPEERRESGDWWRRELAGDFLPVIGRQP